MPEGPENAASLFVLDALPGQLLRPETWVVDGQPRVLAPHFVHHRRRQLAVGLPPLNRDEFRETQRELADVMGHHADVAAEAIAVRGERLAIVRILVTTEQGDVLPFVSIFQVTESLDQIELAATYDPEDEDAAIAELDRLHAELGGD